MRLVDYMTKNMESVKADLGKLQTEVTKNKPVDHVIMAIVDELVVGNDIKFKK
jgi:hypothetical protein